MNTVLKIETNKEETCKTEKKYTIEEYLYSENEISIHKGRNKNFPKLKIEWSQHTFGRSCDT